MGGLLVLVLILGCANATDMEGYIQRLTVPTLGGTQIKDLQITEPIKTNLERELLFLQSHSVHHYAIIAAMTRLIGERPAVEFGVAFATRTFNEEQSILKANADEDVVCAQ